jgi:hypothetical protein
MCTAQFVIKLVCAHLYDFAAVALVSADFRPQVQ